MRVDVQKLADVPDVLIERWRDLQRLAPEFGCPLVGPDFALLVARHRPETQVAIGFNGESGVAFFAFHRGSRGHVRAVGAPFCDYQAVVTDPGVKVDGDAFLAAAGIRSLSFTSLMDPYEIFVGCRPELECDQADYQLHLPGLQSPAIDLRSEW